MVRIDGTARVEEGDSIESIVVINGNAIIDGVVRGTVVAVNGDVNVAGRVDGNVTVVRGVLTLQANSQVDDVTLIRSSLVRADGAVVTGNIERTPESFMRGYSPLSRTLARYRCPQMSHLRCLEPHVTIRDSNHERCSLPIARSESQITAMRGSNAAGNRQSET